MMNKVSFQPSHIQQLFLNLASMCLRIFDLYNEFPIIISFYILSDMLFEIQKNDYQSAFPLVMDE